MSDWTPKPGDRVWRGRFGPMGEVVRLVNAHEDVAIVKWDTGWKGPALFADLSPRSRPKCKRCGGSGLDHRCNTEQA